MRIILCLPVADGSALVQRSVVITSATLSGLSKIVAAV
jgi:hypothetical protein